MSERRQNEMDVVRDYSVLCRKGSGGMVYIGSVLSFLGMKKFSWFYCGIEKSIDFILSEVPLLLQNSFAIRLCNPFFKSIVCCDFKCLKLYGKGVIYKTFYYSCSGFVNSLPNVLMSTFMQDFQKCLIVD